MFPLSDGGPDDSAAPPVAPRGLRGARSLAEDFLAEQVNLGRARLTVAAQRADLDDYFDFCRKTHADPLAAGALHVARYINDLRERAPGAKGRPRVGEGLATATIRRRLSSVRCWYEHLVFDGVRPRNPVRATLRGRRRSTAGDTRRALVPADPRVPWIPTRAEWTRIIQAAAQRGLRDLTMLLTQYDGALRREELVRLSIRDVLPLADAAVRVPRVKTGRGRTVHISAVTADLLERHLDVRFAAAESPDEALFVSEGPRNRGGRLSPSMWSRIVLELQLGTKLAGFSTHTMRHLRLTHLAGADWTLEELAEYAGHASVDTTRIYLHMRDSRLREKYARTSATLDAWMRGVVARGLASGPDAPSPSLSGSP